MCGLYSGRRGRAEPLATRPPLSRHSPAPSCGALASAIVPALVVTQPVAATRGQPDKPLPFQAVGSWIQIGVEAVGPFDPASEARNHRWPTRAPDRRVPEERV